MFWKSSLLPNSAPCNTPCGGNWFGWRSPIGLPGYMEIGGFGAYGSGIQVGPVKSTNFLGDPINVNYSPSSFTFNGGAYHEEYTSAQLAPGIWRIFAVWSGFAIVASNSFNARIPSSDITRRLLNDGTALSLIKKDKSLISTVQLEPAGGTGGNPAIFLNPIEFGGIDGCGHHYETQWGQWGGTSGNLADLVFCADVLIPRTETYLRAVMSQNIADVLTACAAIGDNFVADYNCSYMVGGFYLSGCQCGGFMRSSYAWGF